MCIRDSLGAAQAVQLERGSEAAVGDGAGEGRAGALPRVVVERPRQADGQARRRARRRRARRHRRAHGRAACGAAPRHHLAGGANSKPLSLSLSLFHTQHSLIQ
eukprot:4249304-Pleurochrysis_carterae.AAC.1